jgi:hypothetical protein
MSESHEKRGRAQRKKLKRTEKAERKKVRREQDAAAPPPDVVDVSHFFPLGRDVPEVRPPQSPPSPSRSTIPKTTGFGG